LNLRAIGLIASSAVITAVTFISCKHSPYVLPADQRTSSADICFERDVLPIFTTNCAKSGCHNSTGNGEGSDWVFTSYASITNRGVVPGNPAASRVYQAITGTEGEKMPPKGNPALTQAQVDIIYKWIASGAMDGTNCPTACDTGNYTYSGAIAPMMATYCTGCHYAGAKAVAGVYLDSYYGVQTAGADSASLLGALRHSSGYVAMPQSGNQLSDCQITQVEKWIKNGMQND